MTPSDRAKRILELVAQLDGASHEQLVAAVAAELDGCAPAASGSRASSQDEGRRRDLDAARGALRESLELNQRILEAVPAGVVVVSPSGEVLQANAEAVSFLGLEVDELTRRCVADFEPVTYYEDGRPCPVEDYPVARCLRTREPQPPMVIGVQRAGSGISWGLFSATPLTDPVTQRFLGAVVMVVDLTARRRIEEALRRSEERFRLLVQNLPSYVLVVDSQDRIEYLNRRSPGHEHLDPIGRSCFDFIPPERHDGLRESLRRAMIDRLPSRRETRDLQGRWYLSQTLPLGLADDGEPRAMILAEDVTEQKQAEERLRRSEASFRTLLQGLPDHVTVVTEEGTIQYINHTAPGFDAALVVGRTSQEFLHPADRAKFERRLAAAIERNEASYDEVQIEDGRWFGSQIVPLEPDPDAARPRLALIIGADLSRRRAAERERAALETRIQQAQKFESLEVLASGIAHDFNNLLVGVLGNAELALLRLEPEHEARPLVADARVAALRASELTRQLLAYSGRGKVQVVPVDVNEVLVETVQLVRATISRKAELRLELADDLPGVEADPTQLRQVIMNLLTNASEALLGGAGTIAIRTGIMTREQALAEAAYAVSDLSAPTYVFVTVADDGAGMDQATTARMFDPFFTTKLTGRGLGLAAVLGIVRGHGGAVSVASAPGRGSTFRLMLPSLDRPGTPRRLAPIRAEEAPKAHGTVLVIDDEHHVRQVARLALEESGFRVLLASNGREGLDALAQVGGEVDAIILDFLMHDMDGEEVLGLIEQEFGRRIPVILSTGLGGEVANRSSLSGRVTSFLDKPYRLEQLIEEVQRAIHRASAPILEQEHVEGHGTEQAYP